MPAIKIKFTIKELNERLKYLGVPQTKWNRKTLLDIYYYTYRDTLTRDMAESKISDAITYNTIWKTDIDMTGNRKD
jgi:hypothetical protein